MCCKLCGREDASCTREWNRLKCGGYRPKAGQKHRIFLSSERVRLVYSSLHHPSVQFRGLWFYLRQRLVCHCLRVKRWLLRQPCREEARPSCFKGVVGSCKAGRDAGRCPMTSSLLVLTAGGRAGARLFPLRRFPCDSASSSAQGYQPPRHRLQAPRGFASGNRPAQTVGLLSYTPYSPPALPTYSGMKR